MNWTTIATLIMAAATCLMTIAVFCQARKTGELAKQNKELVKLNEEMLKENRRLAKRSRIKELIGQGLDPLIDTMHQVGEVWSGSEFSFINFQDIKLSKKVESEFKFNKILYYDLKEMEPLLIGKIEEYDNKIDEFWKSLLDSSNLESRKTTIKISDLLNADAVRGLIRENSHSFREEIKKIRERSCRVREKYQHEYHLTEEELEDSKAKIKILRNLLGTI